MSTELPTHIGGYQHLAPDVITKDGDILVFDGKPVGFLTTLVGLTVERAEELSQCRVYRKMACPKQGGDRPLTVDEVANLSGLQNIPETERRVPQAEPPPCPAGSKADPLPSDPKARKAIPIYSGFIRYFPRAIAAVAELSRIGNDQHNPGKPLHWDRSKSGDEHDALMRHLMQAGTKDSDGVLHSTKAAWRAMAALEKELEQAEGQ